VPSKKISIYLIGYAKIVGKGCTMPGRESDYERGYIRGVSAMMHLISSDKVKRLDKTNVLQYARELVESLKEKDNVND
jgi:hypothetical protein